METRNGIRKRRPPVIIVVLCIILVVVVLALLGWSINKNRIDTLSAEPTGFIRDEYALRRNVVRSEKAAVAIAKAAITALDGEKISTHGPFEVYHDRDNNQWLVIARGTLHGEAYLIIDAKDGAIASYIHTKF